jgi:hypothetical protein
LTNALMAVLVCVVYAFWATRTSAFAWSIAALIAAESQVGGASSAWTGDVAPAMPMMLITAAAHERPNVAEFTSLPLVSCYSLERL